MSCFFARPAASSYSCASGNLSPWGRCPQTPGVFRIGPRGPLKVPRHGVLPAATPRRWPLWHRPLLRLLSSRAVSCERCTTLSFNPLNTSHFRANPQKSSFAPSPLSSFEPSLSSFVPAPTGGDSMASLTGCWTMGRGAGRVDAKWEFSYFYDGSPEPFAPAI